MNDCVETAVYNIAARATAASRCFLTYFFFYRVVRRVLLTLWNALGFQQSVFSKQKCEKKKEK